MAITNKLITFNKLTSFETQLAQGNILETSIVFIKDAKKIWTKGTYFDCSGGGSSIPIIEGLVITSSGTLNEAQLAVLNNSPKVFIAQIKIGQSMRGFAVFGRIPVGEGDSDGAFAANIEKDYFIFNYFGNTYSLTQTELALKSDIPDTSSFAAASDMQEAQVRILSLQNAMPKKQDRFKINGRTINLDEDIEVAELDLGSNGRYAMADGLVDSEDNYYSLPSNPDNYGAANILATRDEIGYTTEFSVADIEAVYGRGITKPINVQGLVSAIEANRPIIIPTNITDASQVGGNAVTMAKMENDGFIYLNVIVPYLDGVHKEYFIQIKITTAQLIKSGSNGSITLKELVAKTDLKTINGESILGSGDIVVQGGGDNRYFTEFTVDDFIRACKNESPLVSNGLCDAIINNKIICVPYSFESYNSGHIIASCNYNYSEDSITVPYSFDCIIERYQTTYHLFCSSSVVNNDTFVGALPTTACSQVVYLDSWIEEFEDNTTYIMDSGVKVNDLFIVGSFSMGVTIRFITGDNPSLEFAGYYVLWANGVIPEIEPNTWYELSLTTTSGGHTLAVLTAFKSV